MRGRNVGKREWIKEKPPLGAVLAPVTGLIGGRNHASKMHRFPPFVVESSPCISNSRMFHLIPAGWNRAGPVSQWPRADRLRHRVKTNNGRT